MTDGWSFVFGTRTTQMVSLTRMDKKIAVLLIQLGAIVLLAVGIIVAGWWSDMRSASKVLIAGCAATVPLGFIFGTGFNAETPFALFMVLAVALFLMGFTYGPLGEWLTALFPARVRYSGSSFAFNVGGIIGGALAPMAAQYLVSTHGVSAVGLYLSAAAVISLIGLVWLAPLESRAV